MLEFSGCKDETCLNALLTYILCEHVVSRDALLLTYLLTYCDVQDAVQWCLAVQECAMHAEWPPSALKQWPTELDPDTRQPLFRGPRMKMGIAEGVPGSITPDHNGRADYLGPSVNQAARLMDAGEGSRVGN